MINTTNKTKLFGILGTPVEHTLSPKMHSFIAESENIDMAYLAFDVKSEDLHTAFLGLNSIGASGFNITSPHKTEIIKELYEVKSDAKNIGAVNTIVNKGGKWYGYNTDGDGFCNSLILEDCQIKGKDILILGAGGAARSVCYKLAEFGANSLTVVSRTPRKANKIEEIVKKYSSCKFYTEIDKNKKYDIIINATPLGMHPYLDKNPCDFMELIDENTVCCDLIYNPAKTVFLKEAQVRSAKIINGLGMLIMQGIIAFEYFNDVKLDYKKYYEELTEILKDYKI